MKEKSASLTFKPKEKVVILPYKRTLKGHRYAITNFGRVIRFKTIPKEGEFIKHYLITAGYPGVFMMINGKRTNSLIHRLVAMAFLPKPKRDQVFVIHLDRNPRNNFYQNLQWVNKEEHLQHAMSGKKWKESYKHSRNYKLTEEKVRMLKRLMKDEKADIKKLARKFGVSDMQLYRIRSGENWGWVK